MTEHDPATELKARQGGASERKSDDDATHADAGGGNGQEAAPKTGGGAAEDTPLSLAEQSAWKEATRKSLLADVRKQVKAETDRAKAEAEAKAKGDWEALAKSQADEITQLKAEREQTQLKELRRTVALRHHLSEDLVVFLVGTTEEEIEANAKVLAKAVKPPVAADTEAGDRSAAKPAPSHRQIDLDKPVPKDQLPDYSFLPRHAVPIPTDR